MSRSRSEGDRHRGSDCAWVGSADVGLAAIGAVSPMSGMLLSAEAAGMPPCAVEWVAPGVVEVCDPNVWLPVESVPWCDVP